MGMTIDNVLEILEKHKSRIPSNVFYELKADIVNFEEPTTKNDLRVKEKDDYEMIGITFAMIIFFIIVVILLNILLPFPT